MGPVVGEEFQRVLGRLGIEVLGGVGFEGGDTDGGGQGDKTGKGEGEKKRKQVLLGLISHIGGHKFAGNVILYLPPDSGAVSGADGAGQGEGEGEGDGVNMLAGRGIWYGRVEPRHVEGIVKETVLKGVVIKELFRGGVNADGRVMQIE